MIRNAIDTTPFLAALDPGIDKTVCLLRDHGFNTINSCEGGAGHSCDQPTIEVELPDMQSVESLATTLVEIGQRCRTMVSGHAEQLYSWVIGSEGFNDNDSDKEWNG